MKYRFTSTELLVFFIELAVSIIIGSISSFWLSGEKALLIGFSALFLTQIIQTRIIANKLHQQHMLMNQFISDFQTRDKFSELIISYGLQAFNKISHKSVSVGKDDAWNFWRDCISKMNSKWSTTNYTLAAKGWGLAWWGESTVLTQQERIMNGCSVERVFIVDSEEEMIDILNIVKKQQDAGINVSWLLKDKFLEVEVIKDIQKNLGTLDIAIVDDSWACVTYLDKYRNVIGVTATKDTDVLEKGIFLIREAKKLSHPFSFGTGSN